MGALKKKLCKFFFLIVLLRKTLSLLLLCIEIKDMNVIILCYGVSTKNFI